MRSAQISFANKKVWIIGGGNQAWKKGREFIEEGAKVVFLAPSFHPEIEAYTCICKEYQSEDIQEGFLVYACTDDRQLNHQIVMDANEKGLLSGSVHRDVDASYHPLQFADYPNMHIAVSTNGAAPAYNKELIADFHKVYEEVHHEKLVKLRLEREQRIRLVE